MTGRGAGSHVLASIAIVALLAGCGGGSQSPSAASNASGQPATPTPTLAHGPAGFSPAGSMTYARAYHTATLLADGRGVSWLATTAACHQRPSSGRPQGRRDLLGGVIV